MGNARTIALVLTAAATSIALAALIQSNPSPLTNREPLVPGVSSWMKAHPETGVIKFIR